MHPSTCYISKACICNKNFVFLLTHRHQRLLQSHILTPKHIRHSANSVLLSQRYLIKDVCSNDSVFIMMSHVMPHSGITYFFIMYGFIFSSEGKCTNPSIISINWNWYCPLASLINTYLFGFPTLAEEFFQGLSITMLQLLGTRFQNTRNIHFH